MRKLTLIALLIFCAALQAQVESKKTDWKSLKNDKSVSKKEVLWLENNLNKEARKKIINMVSSLSKPEAAQLLTSYFYMDGSYRNRINKKYLDSFAIRPPSGKAGIIRVAYLATKLRLENFQLLKPNKVYKASFDNQKLNIPSFKRKDINKKINLHFDYKPANIIIEILSKPNVSYEEIIKKTNLHQFNKMIDHRNQSFYKLPINKELLATCLQIATSNKPIHQLYRYANPYGLLNFSDVKNNLEKYKEVITNLSNNETEIFNYIIANISPLLPNKAKFNRKVSFFFMNGSDGWASGDVTGLDLNYYKDNYKTLLNVLMHETYHTGQNAISLNIKSNKKEPYKSFESTLSYLFGEGTASYLAPPKIISTSENKLKIKQGIELVHSYFENTIKTHNKKEAIKIRNKGIAGGGPFYWLGAEMSRIIVAEYNTKKLASIIPYDGVKFFQTYFKAIKKSRKNKNLFSKEFTQYVNSL